MIKLHKPLPTTITVEGREFFIKTDFRYWLLFSKIIQNKNVKLKDLFFLFEDEIPVCDFTEALLDFFINPNSTPTGSDDGERVIDYEEDGEYIYASFMQAYGIDLFEVNLHWHKFKALILGLPSGTIMSEIMGMRGYKKDNRKLEVIAQEKKKKWALPNKEEKELLEEIDKLFYNS